MGGGSYSTTAHEALLQKRASIPVQQVFKQQTCHALMDPKGVKLRECRDSTDHPQSLGIVFALDVTGSMGEIPKLLAKQQLPIFMKTLVDCKIPDPQILFMAVGDGIKDKSPLQVGQFESTAELMDKWLTSTFLEGGGGGNKMESYELAMYFLATHTEMDCMVKRNKRGYLFLTGDELPYPQLAKSVVENIIGDKLDDDLTCEEIVTEVKKTYEPFFLIPDRQRAEQIQARWQGLLGDHTLILDNATDVCYAAAGAILLHEKRVSNIDELVHLLKGAGMPSDRSDEILAALKPLAESILGTGNTTPHSNNPISNLFDGIRKLID